MTTDEFREEFDLLYNNLTSNSAPPLDDYERSVLLTQAQDRLVTIYYDAIRSTTRDGFESNEVRRRELAPLVKTAINVSPNVDTTRQLNETSRFFDLASDVRYIVYEQATLSSTDVCLNNKTASITPVKHDEYSYIIKNPFKKPNKSNVLRLDIEGVNEIELIAPDNSFVTKYQYRYLSNPQPIILSDLTGGLTINGSTTEATCQLAESAHRKVLDLAVQMALEAVGNPRLQSKISVDNKTEY